MREHNFRKFNVIWLQVLVVLTFINQWLFQKIFRPYRNGSDFYPEGLRQVLGRVSALYPMTSLYVTDVGLLTDTDDNKDVARVDVIRAYVDEVLKGKCVTLWKRKTDLSYSARNIPTG